MPDWLKIVVGLLVGGAVIFGAICLAIRPYVRRKHGRSWMADADDKLAGWTGWASWTDHPPPPSGD